MTRLRTRAFPGLSPLRRRIRELFAREDVPPPGLSAFLEETLSERIGGLDPSVAQEVVGDLTAFLAAQYGPRGSLRERRSLPRPAGQPVELLWEHRGELMTDTGFVHRRLEESLSDALERFLKDRWPLDDLLRIVERAAASWDLGRRLVGLLAEVERGRLAAWTRPRTARAVSYCACVGEVPREVWDAVLESSAQRAEWTELFELEAPGPGAAGRAFLAEHPTLVVDTAHHGERVTAAVAAALGERPNLLVLGDNAHALRLLQDRLRGEVQCIYVDPPFNTESGAWAYADRLPRAAWLCFMEERIALARELLRPDGTLYVHIDQHEKERLRLLLDDHLHYVAEIIWRIGWVSGFKTRANKFIRNHDTIYQYGRGKKPLFLKRYLPYPEGYLRRDGKPPTGKGIPLEDTWNCSESDRLDSIQIMSFSREKVGCGNLTQKNENLLERMLLASSRPGDWVLDFFLGSGTTAAVAHKTGRRWVGVERVEVGRPHTLPRLKRVLYGDRYGISKAHGWAGGGGFQLLDLGE